jgi:hypothetical protein
VHRAHAHVPDEQEREVVDAPALSPRRVQVGEDLRGVLAPPVAAVDDRNARPLRRLGRRALLEVPDSQDVAVVLEHVEGVLDGLLVEVACPSHLRVGEADDVAAQPVHRRLGCEPRTCAGLVEGSHQRLVGEQVRVPSFLRDGPELLRNLEHPEVLVALEVLQRQDVAPQEAAHRSPSLSPALLALGVTCGLR